MGWFVAIGTGIVIAIGLWWYIRRAKSISTSDDERHVFQRDLMLDLQDIRDRTEGELAVALDELIEIARYDTPASNELTAELDRQISDEVRLLAATPTIEGASSLKAKLVSRNRRARQ